MVARDVSARAWPCAVAMMLNVPVFDPAVYSPPWVMVPPAAANVTLTAWMELSLIFPWGTNCFVPPVSRVTVSGASITRTNVAAAVVTVTFEVPLALALVAVIVTGPPAVTPVTTPLALTMARPVLALVQVTVRPVNTLPLESRSVAVRVVVAPTTTPAVAGDTVTEATGTRVTVMAAVPVCPSLVAVIVTGPPAATPVTTPVALTVATDGSALVQATMRPVRMLFPASRVVAERASVRPTYTLPVPGATVTEATGLFTTVMAAVPTWPSLMALIVAGPTAFAVTSPEAFTEAAAGLLLAQLITRPVSATPLASLGTAVSCAVVVTWRVSAAGITCTDATGTLATVMLPLAVTPL